MTLADVAPELSPYYKDRNASIDAYKAVEAFFHMFGIPPAGVSSEFRRKLQECAERNHPNLACSAARALFEGRVPGIPKPVSPIEPGWMLRVEVGLILLDCFETLVKETMNNAIEDSKTKKGDASRSRR